ncbi:MAG: hypothetical protein ACI4RO_01155 [Candidatus Scatosoma sp.]
MRFKRIGSTSLSLLLGASALFVGACGKKDEVIKDGKTVNVRMLKAGYGEEFIYELKDAFENAYKEEGYKVNVLTPMSDMRGNVALQEMARGNAATGVDLYIITDVKVDQVGANGDYGIIAEDIRESVYEKPAIGYDGKEEERTVKEKIKDDIEPYLVDKNGVMYGFNWSQSTAGLVVNTRKLAKYGITELPRTTNEMFDVFEKIYMGTNGVENSYKTTTYPVTYVSGMNGYTACAFWTWFSQYDPAGYQEFLSMKDYETGADMIEDGYKVFNSEALEEMLTLAYRSMDQRIAANGSTTQTLDQAQAKIMKDKNDAIFMFNGDWMLNEVKLNYRNYLNDIEFINTPVNSALGVKLFCKAPYNLTEEKADELLSLIAKLTDERKTVQEIVAEVKTATGVDLSEDDALTVATARGTVFARGIEHMAYITKDSPNKEIAALLLRMMASDDFAKTFVKYANSATPYANIESLSEDVEYKFVRQAFNIATNPYISSISSFYSGIRSQLVNTQLPGVTHIASSIYQQIVSVYDGQGGKIDGADISVYKTAANKMMYDSYTLAQKNWNEWLKNAGLK